MAGFWNQSQSQINDLNGKPMVGAKAYFFLGGTSTPITVYQAFALGSVNAHPNPLSADGYGRWPSVYLDEADEFYRVRVTTAQGVIVYDIDGLPIIGPAAGGGGGGDNPVNPDAVLMTGDIKYRYDDGFLSGFVRVNGRTIGSAVSGASERANSDTQALFEYLWNKNSNIVVVGGRGASSLADWTANKQLQLPDWRGRTLVGLDTMGNIAAGVLSAATQLGAGGGSQSHTLTINEMPSHMHNVSEEPHTHGFGGGVPIANAGSALNTGGAPQSAVINETQGAVTGIAIQNAGGGLSHNNLQPYAPVTIYMRL